MEQFANFIAGRHAPAARGQWLDVFEPATGTVYAQVAASDGADVQAAVDAARTAFPAWAGMRAAERSQIIFRLASLIESNLDALAQAESRDSGKPVRLARVVDIPRAATNFRFFAGAVLHTQGEMFETDQAAATGDVHALNYTLRRPRGVAGLISPWNLPLYLLTWKIAPAIATGNTCVAKPSEVTPATATMLGSLANEAGIPPGVINIVHGLGAACGSALVQHPDVPAISFTGSTPVGRAIARDAGERLKRVSLELGGKNPFLIFADADIDEAIATAARAAFTNQGQICLCGARLLVEESIAPRVIAGLTAAARALRLGDPSDPATQFGALVSRAHLDKVHTMVQEARSLGGIIHCGGRKADPASLPPRCRNGYFFEPTVISGLSPTCRIEQEEIFGPVVTVQTFRDDAEATHLANGTAYGLAATLFTRDLTRAHRMAERIDAGIVWINTWMLRDLRTPFGGAKASGVGREGGTEAIRFFTEPKNVCVRY